MATEKQRYRPVVIHLWGQPDALTFRTGVTPFYILTGIKKARYVRAELSAPVIMYDSAKIQQISIQREKMQK